MPEILQDMKEQLDRLLMAKPETGEQWADICLLEQQIIDWSKQRIGGPTKADPHRPYCKPDQSCCDFCCGN